MRWPLVSDSLQILRIYLIMTKYTFIQSSGFSGFEHFRAAKERQAQIKLVVRELNKVKDPFESLIKTMECPPMLQKYTYTPDYTQDFRDVHIS